MRFVTVQGISGFPFQKIRRGASCCGWKIRSKQGRALTWSGCSTVFIQGTLQGHRKHGLGLAVVKLLAEKLGGEVTATLTRNWLAVTLNLYADL